MFSAQKNPLKTVSDVVVVNVRGGSLGRESIAKASPHR